VWVRLVFLDDSEQTNPLRAGLRRLLAVGAVIVSEAAVAGYAADLAAIRTDLDVPPGEELRSCAIRRAYLRSSIPDCSTRWNVARPTKASVGRRMSPNM
jgi:hypothetical protein